ncbi:MAG: hypothetical protein ACYTG0_27945 [Planctomycetota bacterium]|jgi:hypothetical protein
MKRLTNAIALLGIAMLLAGCGQSDEAAPEPSSFGNLPTDFGTGGSAGGDGASDADGVNAELFALLDETADLFASIRDESSARAAAPKFVSIEKRKQEVQEKLQQWQATLSAEESRRLADQHGRELMARTQRVVQETQRLQAMPEVWNALQEEAQALLAEEATP